MSTTGTLEVENTLMSITGALKVENTLMSTTGTLEVENTLMSTVGALKAKNKLISQIPFLSVLLTTYFSFCKPRICYNHHGKEYGRLFKWLTLHLSQQLIHPDIPIMDDWIFKIYSRCQLSFFQFQ